MKFEFEIPDEVMKEAVKQQVSNIYQPYSSRGLNQVINSHIENIIAEHLSKQVTEQLNTVLFEKINKAIEQKVDGWLKRRIKESLEQVRKSIGSK